MKAMQKSSLANTLLNPTNTTAKFVALILFVMYLVAIFGIALSRFTTTDPVPEIKAITTDVIKKLGPFTVKVNAGLFIRNFPIFDINKNNFLIDGIVWFEFNADEIMLETIEKFSFDKGKITYKSPPDIRMDGKRMFVRYNVLVELKTDLQFDKFPFEDHIMPIMLSNDFVTPEEMYFMVDAAAFQVAPNIIPSSWKLTDLRIDSGFLPMQFDKQDKDKKTENPKALFLLRFGKASSKRVMVIFIPLFSAMLLSLLSFTMNIANVVGKFSLAISAVSALLGYRFVIEQIMPSVGYTTTTDALYLVLLFFSFLCFTIQLILTRYFMLYGNKKPESEHEPSVEVRLERISGILFSIVYLSLAIIAGFLVLS